MICDLCRKKASRLHRGVQGSYCDSCVDGAEERTKKLYAELRAEELMLMPEMLKIEDFERFMLKMSLFYLDHLKPEDIRHFRATAPQILQPFFMCLHLKDLVVEKMPLNYVSSMEAGEDARGTYGGTYQFKREVPDSVIIKALEDAGLISKREKGEGS